MSLKRPSRNSQQHREPHFFLDRQLGAFVLASILRPAGLKVITHQERYGTQRDDEPDPNIALECGRRCNVLITADPDFETLYAAEVRQAKIAVFLLSNNHDGPQKWGARIIKARESMMKELGRRRKPFIAHISVNGEVTSVRMYYKKKVKVINIRKPRTCKPLRADNAALAASAHN